MLTPREVSILVLLSEGRSQREVAAALNISPHTVDSHVRKIYRKLDVRSQTAAVAKAILTGALVMDTGPGDAGGR